MTVQTTYPRISAVKPLLGKRLLVTFTTGERKIYDCTPLLNDEAFHPLHDEQLFRQVRSDVGGCAVVWDDSIDLAESELWLNGKPADSEAD
jgi:Protein of unknown function (DUF2442)